MPPLTNINSLPNIIPPNISDPTYKPNSYFWVEHITIKKVKGLTINETKSLVVSEPLSIKDMPQFKGNSNIIHNSITIILLY